MRRCARSRAALLWGMLALLANGCGDGPPAARDGGPPAGPVDAAAPAAIDAMPPDVLPEPMPEPGEICAPPVTPVDVSRPDAVVGAGTPASCTEAALDAALAAGGVVVFDCGPAPHTITVTSEKQIARNTVMDGGGRITLSGGGATRILSIAAPVDADQPRLTLQRLTLRHGAATSSGGAVRRVGGTLTIIHSAIADSAAPAEGPDVAGGAIFARGGGLTTITGSAFVGNRASNGGAIAVVDGDLLLVNTALWQNQATGATGATDGPGRGGSGGAVLVNGAGLDVSVCGADLRDNQAQSFGGAIFHAASDDQGAHTIDRTAFHDNQVVDQSPSVGGALYLEAVDVTITGTTIAGNQARTAGGVYLGPRATVSMVNTTIADNTALASQGGGISMAGDVTGTIRNCTLAANRAPAPMGFAGAMVGGRDVLLANTIVWGSEVGHGYSPISCRDTLMEGGGNLQWPIDRAGAGDDDPEALCSPYALTADALLGPLADHGGPTLTIMPAPGSPAMGLGMDCPDTDQRGMPRGEPCTSGALEAPEP